MTLKMVPYIPTPYMIIADILGIAEARPEDVLIDLGSGDGRILIKAVEEYNVQKAIGYEIRSDLFKVSLLEIQKRNLQDRITVYNKDFLEVDIPTASVVTLYLSPDMNKNLRPKLEGELGLGTRIISITYKIDGWKGNKFSCGGFSRSRQLPYRWNSYYYPIYKYIVPYAFN